MTDPLTVLAQWWVAAAGASDVPAISAPAFVHITRANQPLGNDLVAQLAGRHDVMILSTDHEPNDVAPAVSCALITRQDAASVTGKHFDAANRLDHDAWMRTCAAIRDEIVKRRQHDLAPAQAAASMTGRGTGQDDRIASCVSILQAAANAQLPVLLTGPGAAAALLIAETESANVAGNCKPLQIGTSPVERETWRYLDLTPVLPLATAQTGPSLGHVAVGLINCAIQGQQFGPQPEAAVAGPAVEPGDQGPTVDTASTVGSEHGWQGE